MSGAVPQQMDWTSKPIVASVLVSPPGTILSRRRIEAPRPGDSLL